MTKTTQQYVVTAQDLSAYKEDGAVLLKSVFDETWLCRLRESTDQSLTQAANYFHRQRVWEHDRTYREYCLESLTPSIAAAFMESSKVNLLYDQVFAKTAGDPATPWHNDLPYWPVRNGKAVTVWLALDSISLNSGPLEFIAGSHLWNKWYQPFTTVEDGSQGEFYNATDNVFEPLPDFESERDRHRILCWEMQAGDVMVFDSMIVHGARANTSAAIRRGYAVRYTDEDMTYHRDVQINRFIVNPQLKTGDALDSEQYPAVNFAR